MSDHQKVETPLENSGSSGHRFRFVLRYVTWAWDDNSGSNSSVERAWSVPFLWLAVLVLWVRREDWFMGGSVSDALTGRTLYHVYSAGNILGDGRAHVVSGPASVDG